MATNDKGQPIADYIVTNHGSLFLIESTTPLALQSLHSGVSEAQWFGNALVVEPRYIEPLVAQLREEGWIVE